MKPHLQHSRSRSRKSSSHATLTSADQTEIYIHVYDLLPPGKLSSTLWLLGSALLHTGVVVNDREYAYGGHDRKNITGVYWTRPGLVPPGGRFKLELHVGSTSHPTWEIEEIISDVSAQFQGTSYNLLTRNCNHFTSFLCQKLTGKTAPSWLNRAASIGLALPCIVPREWVNPPDHETAEGALLGDVDRDNDERAAMLGGQEWEAHRRPSSGRLGSRSSTPPPRPVSISATDTSGREMPVSERAPLPRR